MVSTMETTPDPRQQLREAERAAAAPYVDYPRTPGWYAPVVGAWSAALVAVLATRSSHPVLSVVVLVALVAAEGGFLAWYRNKRGTMPSMRQVPPEIRREMSRYLVGLVVVVAAVVAAAVLLSGLLAALLAFVLVTGGLTVYERRYERAAAATRARLR
jgi:hypothetical protein